MRERAVHQNNTHILYIDRVSPNKHVYIKMPVRALSWEVQNGLKLNLVHTYMLISGSAEDKNHNPILNFT